MSLEPRERIALDELADGLRPIFDLLRNSPCHPSDLEDVIAHVHAIQNLVMSRSAVRAHPNHFTHMRTFCEPVRPNELRPVNVCTRQDHPEPLP